jgi:hypothetical protein
VEAAYGQTRQLIALQFCYFGKKFNRTGLRQMKASRQHAISSIAISSTVIVPTFILSTKSVVGPYCERLYESEVAMSMFDVP